MGTYTCHFPVMGSWWWRGFRPVSQATLHIKKKRVNTRYNESAFNFFQVPALLEVFDGPHCSGWRENHPRFKRSTAYTEVSFLPLGLHYHCTSRTITRKMFLTTVKTAQIFALFKAVPNKLIISVTLRVHLGSSDVINSENNSDSIVRDKCKKKM